MHQLPLDALAIWTAQITRPVRIDSASIPAQYETPAPRRPIARLSITVLSALVQTGTLETLELIVDFVSKNAYKVPTFLVSLIIYCLS